MVKKVKELLAEVACVDSKIISADMHLIDDLFLDEAEIDDILNELEDHFGFEIEEGHDPVEYVSDIIAMVKEYV